jgi:hypothetical protein
MNMNMVFVACDHFFSFFSMFRTQHVQNPEQVLTEAMFSFLNICFLKISTKT